MPDIFSIYQFYMILSPQRGAQVEDLGTLLLSIFGWPVAAIMDNVRSLLLLPNVPQILSLCIIFGMIGVLYLGFIRYKKLHNPLQAYSIKIAKIQKDIHSRDSYQEVASIVQDCGADLARAWAKFSQTFVEKQNGDLFLTVSPATFFALERFEGVVQLRRLAKWSGLFVGLGLLLTFLGLVAALSSATDAINAATIGGSQSTDTMQSALKNLLRAATFKFYTSIFGLFASLVVSYSEKFFRRKLEDALRIFCATIENIIPILTPEQLLADQLRESQETTTQIKRFNTELSEGLVRMSSAVASAMNEAMVPVRDSMEQGFSKTSTAMADAVSHAVAPVQQELSQVGQNLGAMEQTIGRTLGENLQSMQEKTLEALAAKLNKVVDQQAGAEITAMVHTLETLSTSLLQMKISLDNGGGAFSATLEAAARELRESVAGLAEATRSISKNVAEDASQAQALLQERLRGIGEEMASALGLMREAMADAAGNVTGQSSQAVAALGKVVEEMADAMRRTAAETGAQTSRHAQEMNSSIANMLHEMREESTRVAQTNQQAMERLLQISTTAGESMGAALTSVNAEVTAQGQAAAAKLTEGATSVLGALNASLEHMATHVGKMSTALNDSGQALATHGRHVREAADSTRSATKALDTAAATLAAATGPVAATQTALTASVRGMEQTVRSLTDATTNMGQRASIAEAAIRQAGAGLEKAWQQHLGRFEHVDEGLAKVLRDITNTMDSNAKRIDDYVQSIDRNLGNAVNQFSESVNDLNDAFESIAKKLPSSR